MKAIRGIRYFFTTGQIGIISRNYDNNISIKFIQKQEKFVPNQNGIS